VPESTDPLPKAWSTEEEFTIPNVNLAAPERKLDGEVIHFL
jgi:hypothetical protein